MTNIKVEDKPATENPLDKKLKQLRKELDELRDHETETNTQTNGAAALELPDIPTPHADLSNNETLQVLKQQLRDLELEPAIVPTAKEIQEAEEISKTIPEPPPLSQEVQMFHNGTAVLEIPDIPTQHEDLSNNEALQILKQQLRDLELEPAIVPTAKEIQDAEEISKTIPDPPPLSQEVKMHHADMTLARLKAELNELNKKQNLKEARKVAKSLPKVPPLSKEVKLDKLHRKFSRLKRELNDLSTAETEGYESGTSEIAFNQLKEKFQRITTGYNSNVTTPAASRRNSIEYATSPGYCYFREFMQTVEEQFATVASPESSSNGSLTEEGIASAIVHERFGFDEEDILEAKASENLSSEPTEEGIFSATTTEEFGFEVTSPEIQFAEKSENASLTPERARELYRAYIESTNIGTNLRQQLYEEFADAFYAKLHTLDKVKIPNRLTPAEAPSYCALVAGAIYFLFKEIGGFPPQELTILKNKLIKNDKNLHPNSTEESRKVYWEKSLLTKKLQPKGSNWGLTRNNIINLVHEVIMEKGAQLEVSLEESEYLKPKF